MKHLEFHINRITRKAGGMFLGIRWHFPVTLVDDWYGIDKTLVWSQQSVNIGLLFWQLDININYNIRTEND